MRALKGRQLHSRGKSFALRPHTAAHTTGRHGDQAQGLLRGNVSRGSCSPGTQSSDGKAPLIVKRLNRTSLDQVGPVLKRHPPPPLWYWYCSAREERSRCCRPRSSSSRRPGASCAPPGRAARPPAAPRASSARPPPPAAVPCASPARQAPSGQPRLAPHPRPPRRQSPPAAASRPSSSRSLRCPRCWRSPPRCWCPPPRRSRCARCACPPRPPPPPACSTTTFSSRPRARGAATRRAA